MSVANQNRFAALYDGEDSGDEQPAVVSSGTKVAAPKTVAVNPTAAPARVIPGAAKKAPAPKKPTEAAPAAEGSAPLSKDDRGEAAHERGTRGGRGRGGRGAANGRSARGTFLGGDRPRRENGGGRPFDRHSQTGHTDSKKQTEQAWGGDDAKRELIAEEEGVADAADAKVESGAATPALEAKAPAVPVEEEDKTLTYDEYLKAQAEKKLNIAKPTARQANEGADQSLWKEGVALAKKTEAPQDWFFGSAESQKQARARKEKEAKTFLEVEFAPIQRPSFGERGGRGGARGGASRGGERGRGAGRGRGEGRGRGAPRGAARGGAAPRGGAGASVNVNDDAAFPTLA